MAGSGESRRVTAARCDLLFQLDFPRSDLMAIATISAFVRALSFRHMAAQSVETKVEEMFSSVAISEGLRP